MIPRIVLFLTVFFASKRQSGGVRDLGSGFIGIVKINNRGFC